MEFFRYILLAILTMFFVVAVGCVIGVLLWLIVSAFAWL